jgi:hypothetical protein
MIGRRGVPEVRCVGKRDAEQRDAPDRQQPASPSVAGR